MFKYINTLVFILVLAPLVSFSQGEFPNTLSYHRTAGSPPATLEAVSWLAGHWRGEAMGGITEELWSPPMAGSMMGSFKFIESDKVIFYELETISEENGTLVLRLKHFNADLKGWEEKEKTVDFKLVKATTGKVFFDGFTIEKVSENEINMYVVIEEGNRKEEVKFNYKRVLN
jgi:uncharacterized protein DUF6265